MLKSRLKPIALLSCLLLFSCSEKGPHLQVAVASNFAPTLEKLSEAFTAQSSIRVEVSSASSGKLYAQILKGAPWDLFLSADERPALLEEKGQGIKGTRFTYALGRLALYQAGPSDDGTSLMRLQSAAFDHLAMANPELAPYGRAASQALERMRLVGKYRDKILYGENAGQAFQCVYTGGAQAGRVSLAQAMQGPGHHWEIPPVLYDPIRQDGILLKDSPQGRSFLKYLSSAPARSRILSAGYGLPES